MCFKFISETPSHDYIIIKRFILFNIHSALKKKENYNSSAFNHLMIKHKYSSKNIDLRMNPTSYFLVAYNGKYQWMNWSKINQKISAGLWSTSVVKQVTATVFCDRDHLRII